MKKTTIVGLLAAFTLVSTCMAVPVMAQSGEITEAQARKIALADAGLNEKDVVFVRSHMDFDDGFRQYEIEFYSGNLEYDYDIDAATGAILSVDQDCEYYASTAAPAQAQAKQAPAAGTTQAKASGITKEQAIEIALKQAGIKKESAEYINAYLDYDDGLEIYDVQFFVNGVEYNFDIDAKSGQIVGYDTDAMEWDD